MQEQRALFFLLCLLNCAHLLLHSVLQTLLRKSCVSLSNLAFITQGQGAYLLLLVVVVIVTEFFFIHQCPMHCLLAHQSSIEMLIKIN